MEHKIKYRPEGWEPSKKEWRAYKKKRKAARKKLKKLLKTYGPWEWGYIQDFMEIIINDMYDYYNEGVNVWQTDETRVPIINQLLKALDLIDQIDKIDNLDCPTSLEEAKRQEDNLQQAYIDFYTHIGKNLRWWWD